MADQELSQAEIWDDSALVDSWNEAFEEYKKYHSLAAKGEKVEVRIEKPVEGVVDGDTTAAVQPSPDAQFMTTGEMALEPEAVAGAQSSAAPASTTAPPALPQMLLSSVPNEDLKNLMMSWYYAGYYTGLYEGKQQGYASAMQHHPA